MRRGERYDLFPRPPQTGWLSLEGLIITKTIKEIDRAGRRWNHHYKFPDLELSGAVPVSGCDAIWPRDNHISTINKTQRGERREENSGEMWGV